MFLLWAIACLIYYDPAGANTAGKSTGESLLYSSQDAAEEYSEPYLTDVQAPSRPTGDVLAHSLDRTLSNYHKLMIYCFFLLCLIIPYYFPEFNFVFLFPRFYQ